METKRYRDSALKKAEIKIRGIFAGNIAGGDPVLVSHAGGAPALPGTPRILFLRQDRIGDVLVSVPIIRAIRGKFPHAGISMLLSPNNSAAQPALKRYVDDVILYEKNLYKIIRLWATLRRARFDIAVDLMDNPSATSTLILKACRSRFTFGIDKANRAAYSHVVPLLDRSRVHIVERLAQLLMLFGQVPSQVPLDLEYPVDEQEMAAAKKLALSAGLTSDQQPIVGINISGSNDQKFYGVERNILIVNHIRRSHPDVQPLVFCSSAHRTQAQEIRSQTGAPIMPATKSFHDFACGLRCCSCIVTPDTSVVHLAAAWKIPALVLYLHDAPELLPWFPYKSPYRALFARQHIGTIPVTEVCGAFDQLVREMPGRTGCVS